MNFKKIWFWFSAALAAATILSVVAVIIQRPLDESYGETSFIFFVAIEVIIFPFLLKYLVNRRNNITLTESQTPTPASSSSLWSIIFAVIGVPMLVFGLPGFLSALPALYAGTLGTSYGWGGVMIFVFGAMALFGFIFLMIAILFAIGSRKSD